MRAAIPVYSRALPLSGQAVEPDPQAGSGEAEESTSCEPSAVAPAWIRSLSATLFAASSFPSGLKLVLRLSCPKVLG
jgi:hypothetical protein